MPFIFYSPFCKRTFSDIGKLKYHVRERHPLTICPFCSEVEGDIIEHYREKWIKENDEKHAVLYYLYEIPYRAYLAKYRSTIKAAREIAMEHLRNFANARKLRQQMKFLAEEESSRC